MLGHNQRVDRRCFVGQLAAAGAAVAGSPMFALAQDARQPTVDDFAAHVGSQFLIQDESGHTLQAELIEAEALETSDLVGKPIRDISIPHGVLFGAIVRDGVVIVPRGNTIVETGDRVILFASTEAVRKVEKMFSVQLEFF